MSELSIKVRPLYAELQGYLSQAPTVAQLLNIYDRGLWQQLQEVISQLSTITDTEYGRFMVEVHPSTTDWGDYIKNTEYRSKLNGLIMNLHATFFAEENAPFGGGPSTVVTQSQTNNTQIQIVMEVQSLIDKQLYGNQELEQIEKTFLEKMKESLPAIKSTAELITTLVTTANSLGLDLTHIAKAFGIHL